MSTNKRATHCVILPILLAVVLVVPAAADLDPLSLGQRNKDNRFAFSVGAFFVHFDSSIAYKASGTGGRVYLDLEGQFDLPATEIVGNLAARFRITERHHIMAEYSRFRRLGDRTLQGETFDVGGTTVEFTGQTTVEMNYDFVDVNYGYVFASDERSTFIGELGVHIFHLKSGYSIVGGLVVDGNTYPSDVEGGDAFTAAFPLLGVAFEFQMARRWIIVNSVDFVYLPVGDTQGAALRTLLAAGFLINRSVGVKLGLSYNYERLEYKTDRATEVVEFDFSGIMASVFFAF